MTLLLVLDLVVAVLAVVFFVVSARRSRRDAAEIRYLRARLAGDDLDRTESVRSIREAAVLEAHSVVGEETRVRWLLHVADQLERGERLV